MHLNVPPANSGKWRSIWSKVQWIALALFAPEIVLFSAYSQYQEARKLVNELKRIQTAQDNNAKGKNEPRESPTRHGSVDAAHESGQEDPQKDVEKEPVSDSKCFLNIC